MNMKFALIGHPLGHSLSPVIHEKLFALDGVKAEYKLLDIPPEKLEDNIPALNALDGYNVTIPHKINIIPFLGGLNEKSSLYGAVNCVNTSQNCGYNTDCTGFVQSVNMMGTNLSGNNLLLGCGGAGRMMAFETALSGGTLTVAVREQSLSKGETLKNDIRKTVPDADVHIVTFDEIQGKFDLCMNSTPVGMYPNIDHSLLSDDTLCNISYLFDAVYNPTETLLMKRARSSGVKTMGGMAMLVLQAAASHEIWLNASYSPKQLSEIIRDMENYL